MLIRVNVALQNVCELYFNEELKEAITTEISLDELLEEIPDPQN